MARETFAIQVPDAVLADLAHRLDTTRWPDEIENGKWDQFDLYVIRKGKAKYLRELEALLIRVAKPTANKTEPKFVKHNNFTKKFEQALHKEIAALFI